MVLIILIFFNFKNDLFTVCLERTVFSNNKKLIKKSQHKHRRLCLYTEKSFIIQVRIGLTRQHLMNFSFFLQ